MTGRVRFNRREINILNDHFNKNNKPTTDELHDLSILLKLDIENIRTWFQNKRMKQKNQYNLSDKPLFLDKPTDLSSLKLDIKLPHRIKSKNYDSTNITSNKLELNQEERFDNFSVENLLKYQFYKNEEKIDENLSQYIDLSKLQEVVSKNIVEPKQENNIISKLEDSKNKRINIQKKSYFNKSSHNKLLKRKINSNKIKYPHDNSIDLNTMNNQGFIQYPYFYQDQSIFRNDSLSTNNPSIVRNGSISMNNPSISNSLSNFNDLQNNTNQIGFNLMNNNNNLYNEFINNSIPLNCSQLMTNYNQLTESSSSNNGQNLYQLNQKEVHINDLVDPNIFNITNDDIKLFYDSNNINNFKKL